MSNIALIIKREYMTMVAKKSFIITTVLVPILMLVVCGVLPVVMSQVKSDEKKLVAVVDQTPDQRYGHLFSSDDEYIYQVVADAAVAPADSTAAPSDESLLSLYHNDESLYAIVLIPADIEQSQRLTIYSEKSVNASLSHNLSWLMRGPLRDSKIDNYQIEGLSDIIRDCDVNLDVRTIKWNEAGEERASNAEIGMVLGLVLAMLIYMFVILYGAMIMNGVVEEKTNRIVEVIVSCCKPFDLMMGKIIGVALVGLTQIAIWVVLLTSVGGFFGLSSMSAMSASPMPLDNPEAVAAIQQAQDPGALAELFQIISGINFTQIFVCFVLFFIGGYLLYASIFAAFGSAVDQPQDASQFMTPIMIIMVFALYAAMFSMENPDGPLAFWCSLIPFTSPIVMMIRLPFDVPFWQLGLSVGLLFATAFAITWLAGRIYRTGILMYGRKFTVKEILRWIR